MLAPPAPPPHQHNPSNGTDRVGQSSSLGWLRSKSPSSQVLGIDDGIITMCDTEQETPQVKHSSRTLLSGPTTQVPGGYEAWRLTLRQMQDLNDAFQEHEVSVTNRERLFVQALRDLQRDVKALIGNAATTTVTTIDEDTREMEDEHEVMPMSPLPVFPSQKEGGAGIGAKQSIPWRSEDGVANNGLQQVHNQVLQPHQWASNESGGTGQLTLKNRSSSKRSLDAHRENTNVSGKVTSISKGSSSHEASDHYNHEWLKKLPAFKLHTDWAVLNRADAGADALNEMRSMEMGDDLDEMAMSGFTQNPSNLHSMCWFIVNPSSMSRLCWDLAGIAVLVWDLFVIPLQLCFNISAQSTPLLIVGWITTIYWSVDIPASCCVAYYRDDGTLETRPRVVLRRYLMSWFPLDLGLVILDWLHRATTSLDTDAMATGLARLGKMLRMVRILRALRLLRLAKLRQLLTLVQAHVDSEWTSTVLHILEYLVFIVAINHWIACVWFKVGTDTTPTIPRWIDIFNEADSLQTTEYKYFTSLHWSLTQFTPASINIQPHNTTERVVAVIVLMFALCIFSSFVSSITTAMTTLRNLSMKSDGQFWLLRKYLRNNSVPASLSARIQRYLTVKLDQHRSHMSEKRVQLLEYLSAPLHEELQYEMYRPSMTEHVLFGVFVTDAPSILKKICSSAVSSVSLSVQDVLFTLGEAAEGMYFLKRGRLLYTGRFCMDRGTVLRPRQYVSEPCLWTSSWVHCGTMHAILDSELVKLGADAFRKVIISHPSEAKLIKEYGREFLDGLNANLHDKGMLSDVNPDLTYTESRALQRISTRPLGIPVRKMFSIGITHARSMPK